MIKNAITEDMKTLTLCLNKLLLEGYTEDFKASDKRLFSIQHEKNYKPHHIHALNFYRFGGRRYLKEGCFG